MMYVVDVRLRLSRTPRAVIALRDRIFYRNIDFITYKTCVIRIFDRNRDFITDKTSAIEEKVSQNKN